MNRLGKICSCIAVLVCCSNTTYAQELNIGVHGSPTLSIPVLDKIGEVSPTLKAKTFSAINASGGVNVNLRINKFCIETGANLTSRTVTFTMKLDEYSFNNLNGSSSIASQSDIRVLGTAWSVPLQIGYQLDHHEAKTVYDVFGIVGAAYESYTVDALGYEAAYVTTGNGPNPNFNNTNGLKPDLGNTTTWVNAIVGFKINAILRKVGLVEYGLRYHFPLANAGLHRMETIVANTTYGSVFKGDFYPRYSYLDFHLTYYFLNLRGMGKPKYRNVH